MFRVINIYNILHVIGVAIVFESFFLLLNLPVAFFYHENTYACFLVSFGLLFFVGGLLQWAVKKEKTELSRRESFYAAFLVWVFMSVFGALPYLLSRTIPEWYNAVFESISGFTTTGSSILTDIEALPKSILFWRALTHWIGGLGILVLVIAFVPSIHRGGSSLIFSEGNTIEAEKLKPRIADVAKSLWMIYFALTAIETLLLCLEGMSVFDALCHSFATIATGGFSTRNDSVASMSTAIQYTIAIFMVLAGMNFVLHFKLVKLRFKDVYRNVELRYYLSIIGVSTILIAIAQLQKVNSVEKVFRTAFFQVSSILSATGFATDDYLQWHDQAKLIIFALMLIGACVGSTGGGIKIKRYVIVLDSIRSFMLKILHPNVVVKRTIDDTTITDDVITKAGSFMTLYFLTIIVGTAILMADTVDFTTAVSSITTTLAGIGPGFGQVGPVSNFNALPVFSKMYLGVNMILGRLEIIPVLALLHPAIRRL